MDKTSTFTIAVCDDDINVRKEINAYTKNHYKNEIRILEFVSGDGLLQKIAEIDVIDLLFLDIEMPGKNGIEIKELLSHNAKVKSIVFVTSHVNVMQDAFGMKVIGFVTKPLQKGKIIHWIDTVYNQFKESKIISFNKDTSFRVINIMYIAADRQYTYVVMNDGKVSEFLRVPIRKWKLKVDNSFIQCHKSYLVNMRFIEKLKFKEILLNNGNNVPVGRKYYQDVKGAYREYILENIKGRIGWDD